MVHSGQYHIIGILSGKIELRRLDFCLSIIRGFGFGFEFELDLRARTVQIGQARWTCMRRRAQGLRRKRGIELDANDDLRLTSMHGGVGSTCVRETKIVRSTRKWCGMGPLHHKNKSKKIEQISVERGRVGREKNDKYVAPTNR